MDMDTYQNCKAAPTVKMAEREMIDFLRPSQSVSAPLGMEPKMQPNENMAVIYPC